jgi:hypothetical protein
MRARTTCLFTASILLLFGATGTSAAPPDQQSGSSADIYNSPPPYLGLIEEAVDQYGENLPDKWFPPIPADPSNPHRPDPLALAISRQVLASVLSDRGYTVKAQRVLQLNASAGMGIMQLPPPNSIDWPGVMSLAGSCEEGTGGALDNSSDTWLRIQGDWGANCGVFGWVGPGSKVGAGAAGWDDVDHIWNCDGDLRVDTTTVTGGLRGWHLRNNTTTTAYDDPSAPDVWLDTCSWQCSWQPWSAC